MRSASLTAISALLCGPSPRCVASRRANGAICGAMSSAPRKAGRRKRTASPGTNLHAHGMYAGPWIDQALLAEVWQQVRKDGSQVVWMKCATDFARGLAHALKYTGKKLSTDPKRLAQLEKAFHGVRRAHTMGAFYNAKDPGPMVPDICCPRRCDGPLEKLANSGLRPAPELQAEGWLSWTRCTGHRKELEQRPRSRTDESLGDYTSTGPPSDISLFVP